MRLFVMTVVASLCIAGCWFEPAQLEGRACTTSEDCVAGFRCEGGTCVRVSDAAMDAPRMDVPLDDVDGGLDVPSDGSVDAGPECGVHGPSFGVGERFACAISDDGAEIYCWGTRGARLGHPVPPDGGVDAGGIASTPELLPLPEGAPNRWGAIAVGLDHACALSCDGELWCWGENDFSQLGRGDATTVGGTAAPAAETPTDDTFTGLCAGSKSGCALARDGRVYCWGENSVGELAIPPATAVASPTLAGFRSSTASINCGARTFCAVGSDRSIECSGRSADGQIPTVDPLTGNDQRIPVRIDLPTTAWELFAQGLEVGCGVPAPQTGEVWCFGEMFDGSRYSGIGGALPDGGVPDAGTGGVAPVAIRVATDPERIIALANANLFACALVEESDTTTDLRCWGSFGADAQPIPTSVGRGMDIIDIVGGHPPFRSQHGTVCARTPEQVCCMGEGVTSDDRESTLRDCVTLP